MNLTLLLAVLLLLPMGGCLAVWRANRRVAGGLAVLFTGAGLIGSGWLLLANESITLHANWAMLSGVPFDLTFRLDGLAALMLVLVHLVALLVQVYSLAYMHDEEKLPRYFACLQLFVGAMLGIVLAGNLLVLYAFWELVGLASYLLIGFYSHRPAAGQAAKKAFLMNRVGDMGLLLGIFLTYYYFDTLDLADLAGVGAYAVPPTVVGLCLFMGCVGKSAQFPLLTWLPDAMEGPTPVSALLHAATMVAAGVFLLARIHPLLSPNALVIVAMVGAITTLWGGYAALFQTDAKKVLAFSTVSQLGLMVAAMGTGNVGAAMFHLLTHAFFKAGLFLSIGSVIHAVHTQDMRQMGGLRRALPFTFVGYTLCAAALAGVPLFSGFLSKEVLIGGAFGASGMGATLPFATGVVRLVPVLLLVSSGLTAVYMVRQWRMVFFGTYPDTAVPLAAVHEPEWLMRGPVAVLAALSVAFWFSPNPVAVSDPGWGILRYLPVLPDVHLPWLAPVSVGLVLAGGWLGFRLRDPNPARVWVQLSVQYGFLDLFYRKFIINPSLKLAALLNRTDQRVVDGLVNGAGVSGVVLAHLTHGLDRFVVDGVVNGAAWVAGRLGRLTRQMQNGRVQSYITVSVLVLLVLLWWIL